MPDMAGHIDWDKVTAETVLPGITRQRVDGDEATVIRYVYQPGAVFPTHHHREEQTTVVLTGRVEFWLGEQHIVLGPGDTLLVPSNASHGARVVGDAVVESINVMAPVRRADLTFKPN